MELTYENRRARMTLGFLAFFVAFTAFDVWLVGSLLGGRLDVQIGLTVGILHALLLGAVHRKALSLRLFRAVKWLTVIGLTEVYAVLARDTGLAALSNGLLNTIATLGIILGASSIVELAFESATYAAEVDVLNAATKTFDSIKWLPKRYADEELGDALERISQLRDAGAPKWRHWACFGNAVFWVTFSVAKDFLALVASLLKIFG